MDETATGSFEADVDQFLSALQELESHLGQLEKKFANAGPGITQHLQGIDAAAAKAAGSLGVMGQSSASAGGFFGRATAGIQGFVGMLSTLSHYTFLIPNSLGVFGTALGNLLGKVTPMGPALVQAFSKSIPAMKTGLHQLGAFDAAVKALTGRLTPLGAALGYVSARMAGVSRSHAAAGAIGGLAFSTLAGGAGMAGNAIRALSGIAVTSLGTVGAAFAGSMPYLLPVAAAIGAVSAAFLVVKKAIRTSGEFETTQTSFRTLIGNADRAKASIASLIAWSDQTPFNKFDITSAGRSLLAYGFAADGLIPILTDIGDVAAAMNKPLEDVASTFGQIQSGNFGNAFQNLRSYGITRQELEAKGLKFDASGQYQGSASQAMSAVRDVVHEKFGGSMEDLSRTWKGQWSKFSSHAGNAMRALGEPMMEALKPAVALLTQVITDMKPLFEILGGLTARMVQTVLVLAKTIYERLRPAMLGLFDVMKKLADKFGFKTPPVEGGRDRKPVTTTEEKKTSPKTSDIHVTSLRSFGGGGAIGLGLGIDPLLDENRRQTRLQERMVELLGGNETAPDPQPRVPYYA